MRGSYLKFRGAYPELCRIYPKFRDAYAGMRRIDAGFREPVKSFVYAGRAQNP
ncbi:hypothetical protein [Treponema endosymbiont of Eucomonympha sp.]|uniref:hypothetical protein n=1 Tax=Treponema endosymbiont of Eucomonympha sp. TaxID=1580831 RepID=UPI00165005BA|nr:hypothetical protein [Treponema endosymbiont of Eucomonympha sp.]